MAGRLDRADHFLGCLLWKPLIFLLVLATAGCVWLAVEVLRGAEGPDRLVGFALALLGALVFGAGAFRAARKRRISEIEP